jgi:hypothetical protein
MLCIGLFYPAASICMYLSMLIPYTLQSTTVSLISTKSKQLLYLTGEKLYIIYAPSTTLQRDDTDPTQHLYFLFVLNL